jgi:hypothetical protein
MTNGNDRNRETRVHADTPFRIPVSINIRNKAEKKKACPSFRVKQKRLIWSIGFIDSNYFLHIITHAIHEQNKEERVFPNGKIQPS